MRAAVQEAGKTPAGRARIALAGVFGGIPGWTQANQPQPAAGDAEAQFEQIIGSFPGGVFLPRGEQEQRAGGNFSWNTGINYTQLLNASGRRGMIEELYTKAGISLEADLATLAAAPRISANPQAVEYMRKHYTPTADPKVPLLAVQAFGDGTTSPSLQRSVCRACPAEDDGFAVSRARRSLFVQRRGDAGIGEAARNPARQRQVAAARAALCSARTRAAAARLFPGQELPLRERRHPGACHDQSHACSE